MKGKYPSKRNRNERGLGGSAMLLAARLLLAGCGGTDSQRAASSLEETALSAVEAGDDAAESEAAEEDKAEEAARIRAEQTHAFCEAAIRRMKAERAEFERQAELLFKKRDAAAKAGFKQMEEALLQDDFDKFSRGLNEITTSFGQKLQFTNFEEFDAFMQTDEAFDL